jgi:hypothetical protein
MRLGRDYPWGFARIKVSLESAAGERILQAMRSLRALMLGVLVMSALDVNAQEQGTNQPLPAAKAKDHVGATTTVVGRIAEVNVSERLVRLNFDRAYPNQTFTVVIFSADTNRFPKVTELKGKTISVTGKITTYRERPEIVLKTPNQLSVVDAGEGGEAKASKTN